MALSSPEPCQKNRSVNVLRENLAESFTINVLGVHWVTTKPPFIPVSPLTKASTTTLGSITLSRSAHYLPAPAYKISKAAMNSLTVQYALDYEKEGFTFMALSPGVCTFFSMLHNTKY